ncbi:30S ribosomal protein S12 methylthiotransferase RimO [Desulfovibrio litoralis]|uniref:Ribosomal protein uS12 methylthiotransferase RimO n=1 Tax=Desulfovibrio litoralis DSM 11393 TaxID=1121455 RepID=A0A1M7SBC8_9BACT|nr:30S ribosomal protein S12 methylthiotransferase RimO [Desulfovibrio litoralis]SHN55765.1 SSU ribosomal protein S12P methylthiotransferase [Desulfovibrio litoralis DSM 11393]
MLKIYPISLGCPKNRVDTEKYLGALSATLSESSEDADLVFINTCGFIQPAIAESVKIILEEIKTRTVYQKNNSDSHTKIVVAGCLVGRYGQGALQEELSEVDLWLDNKDTSNWADLTLNFLNQDEALKNKVNKINYQGRFLTTAPSYAWLKVSDGCEHNCAFCTIPSIRGKLRSRKIIDIHSEAKMLVDGGVKELVLVAQDLLSWGKDLDKTEKKHGIQSVLEKLLSLQGLARLRLMYLYPAGLTKELLSFLQGAGKPFVPYFDIPLQHSHPDILRTMGRPFAQNPELVLDRVREYFPEAALRTSLIVGYPGEKEKHFEHLMNFVEKQRFTHLGVFSFQAEEGTPAALLEQKKSQKVSQKLKEERRKNLMLLQKEISADNLSKYLGHELEFLVDSVHPEWEGLHVARAWFQAPEVDGVSFISGKNVAPNKIIKGEVVETQDYDLSALA